MPRPHAETLTVNTIRPVMTQPHVARSGGLARWRRSMSVRRLSGRISAIMRDLPIVPAVLLILIAALMSVLIAWFPSAVPWSSYVPLVVLAGLFLPPRWLALVLLVVAGLLSLIHISEPTRPY